MRKVWVAETGEYEQRGVSFVAESPESALAYVFKIHPEGGWIASGVETWGHEKQYRRFSIKGQVYIHPSGGNFYLTPHEYELNEEEFAGNP